MIYLVGPPDISVRGATATSRKTYHVPATVNTNCEFSDLITLSVNVVLKLTNSELLIADYAFDEIAN